MIVRFVEARDLPAGTKLTRVFRGEAHVVTVAASGYNPNKPRGKLTAAEKRRRMWRYWYNGRRYRTLSAIAFEITGLRHRNGNDFFGLGGSGRRSNDFDIEQIR